MSGLQFSLWFGDCKSNWSTGLWLTSRLLHHFMDTTLPRRGASSKSPGFASAEASADPLLGGPGLKNFAFCYICIRAELPGLEIFAFCYICISGKRSRGRSGPTRHQPALRRYVPPDVRPGCTPSAYPMPRIGAQGGPPGIHPEPHTPYRRRASSCKLP